MQWQKPQLFQPRLPDFDLRSSMDRVRNPGSPSTAEIGHITREILDAEKDVFDYEQEIARLEELVRCFKEKQDDLKQHINHCKVYLSPIRRLPTEIMSEIFLLCQDKDTSSRDDGQFREPMEISKRIYRQSKCLTALTLSWVCKLWNDIALSTPRLWCRFSLYINRHCNFGRLYQLLETYIVRSKQIPLSFDVGIYTRDDACRSVLQLLMDQCHRWFNTSWDLESVSENARILFSVEKDLPLLSDLVLDAADDDIIYNIFTGAYNIQKMAIQNSSTLPLNSFHWDQLFDLRIEEAEHDEMGVVSLARTLAENCSRLRSLYLKPSCHLLNAPDDLPEMHWTTLESLTLSDATWHEIGGIFSIFTLPSLQRLVIMDCVEGQPEGIERLDTFPSFMSRSRCPLSVLEFKDMRSAYAVRFCEHILRFVPTVTTLGIHRASTSNARMSVTHFSSSFFQNLCYSSISSDTTAVVLPNLQTLALTTTLDHHFDDVGFADMIRSRWIPNETGSSSPHLRCIQSVELCLLNSGKDFELPGALQLLSDTVPCVEIIPVGTSRAD
ncbi:hypothetical protein VKT23_010452 [Stygiomarasmius scandens]|uniref:F-box domain-containing protein n=1 Tax=Marasmiellus scandens TaxID=2682957 RepID=A0ABR1JCB1_9AGAR